MILLDLNLPGVDGYATKIDTGLSGPSGKSGHEVLTIRAADKERRDSGKVKSGADLFAHHGRKQPGPDQCATAVLFVLRQAVA